MTKRDIRKDLAFELRTCRKIHKLTQKELAETLNISQSAVANYERGSRIPDMDILKSYREFFGLDMNALFEVEEIDLPKEDFMDAFYEADFERLALILKKLSKELDYLNIYHDWLLPTLEDMGRKWMDGELSSWNQMRLSRLIKELVVVIKVYYERKELIKKDKRSFFVFKPAFEAHDFILLLASNYLWLAGHDVLYLDENVNVRLILESEKEMKPDILVTSFSCDKDLESMQYLAEKINDRIPVPLVIMGAKSQDIKSYNTYGIHRLMELNTIIGKLND